MMALALSITVLLPTVIKANANSDSDISKLRHTVVYIEVGYEITGGSYIGRFRGSGFFIGKKNADPQYIITNHHVVDYYIKNGSGELRPLSDSNGTARTKIRVYFDDNDWTEAYLVDSRETQDVAVIRSAQPTSKRSAATLEIPTESMVGNKAIAIGYPGLPDNIIFQSLEQKDETASTVISGDISRLLQINGTGVRTIQIDVNILHGNSGGPLFYNDGNVIGINSWGISDEGEEVNYAVSIEEVLPLLNQHSIDYDIAGRNNSKTNYLLIAGIVLIVAGIACIAAYFLKKKKVTLLLKKMWQQ